MTLRDTMLLGRVSNLPTVWSNVLAGTVLAGGAVIPTDTGLVLLAMSLFYVGGMYLNDYFDRAIDRKERPSRPIPSGRVQPGTVLGAGLAMLGLGVALMATCGPLAAGAGATLAAAIIWYDMDHKSNRLSPLLMGACRVLVYVGAAVASVGSLPAPVLWGALALLGYLIGLTYAAKQESLARFEGAWPLACLAAPLALAVTALPNTPLVMLPMLACGGWIIWSTSFLLRGDRPDIPGAIVRYIAGIALVDGLLIAAAGSWALAAAAVGAFALTRVLQRVVPGT